MAFFSFSFPLLFAFLRKPANVDLVHTGVCLYAKRNIQLREQWVIAIAATVHSPTNYIFGLFFSSFSVLSFFVHCFASIQVLFTRPCEQEPLLTVTHCALESISTSFMFFQVTDKLDASSLLHSAFIMHFPLLDWKSNVIFQWIPIKISFIDLNKLNFLIHCMNQCSCDALIQTQSFPVEYNFSA